MTAFDDIGGEGPIRAVLQGLYDRLFGDPIVGFLFEGKDKGRIVEQQVAFTSAFLGGPNRYTGKSMPEVHASVPLLPGHFDRRHHVLKQVLEARGVPDGVRATWLRIDAGLRSSVLASGEEARGMTRKAP
ncbi:MAG TPA: group 1 truncated hemoglobin [Polyangiaceae bacterium]|jgi:hemoglobin